MRSDLRSVSDRLPFFCCKPKQMTDIGWLMAAMTIFLSKPSVNATLCTRSETKSASLSAFYFPVPFSKLTLPLSLLWLYTGKSISYFAVLGQGVGHLHCCWRRGQPTSYQNSPSWTAIVPHYQGQERLSTASADRKLVVYESIGGRKGICVYEGMYTVYYCSSISHPQASQVLHAHGFPVPTPIDQNRHIVVMSLLDAHPLCQVHDVDEPGRLYTKLMDLIVRLACAGLIHGDFNEFNLMITVINAMG